MRNRGPRLDLAGILLGVLLAVYILLDTFVIPHRYIVVPPASSSETFTLPQTASVPPEETKENTVSSGDETPAETPAGYSSETGTGEAVPRESSEQTTEAPSTEPETKVIPPEVLKAGEGFTVIREYSDENITIVLKQYRRHDTDIYVADISLARPDLLKTAFAQDTFGRVIQETTSDIARQHGAIMAISGDCYGMQEVGYVLKNGVIYRASGTRGDEDLAIYADGHMEIVKEVEVPAETLLANGTVHVLAFGPGLIEGGVLTVTPSSKVPREIASNPRTAIGQIGALHYIFLVSDGRTSSNKGLSLYQLGTFMLEELGCELAYNLDGGGSATMVFQDTLINKPTTSGKIWERGMSDIVYIGY